MKKVRWRSHKKHLVSELGSWQKKKLCRTSYYSVTNFINILWTLERSLNGLRSFQFWLSRETKDVNVWLFHDFYKINKKNSSRKLARVEFELRTTEFRLDALTAWAIRPWVQLALRANFVQLLQFHLLFSVRSNMFSIRSFVRQLPRLF